MKSWPLRLKIALWSSLVVALALVVSGAVTARHFYHEDLELLDHLLREEVRGVFSELKRIPPGFDFSAQKLNHVLPAAYRRRHIEIRHAGTIVYRSHKSGPEYFGAESLGPGNYSAGRSGKLRLAIVNKAPWQVRVAFETREARDAAQELLMGSLVALPALLLITAFGGWWIARKALAPIQAVTHAAEQITAARLDQRLPVPASQDEVQHLSLVLNRMIERLERSFHQAQRFSADTSHELRTPLAVVHAGLEAMLVSKEITPTQEQQLLDLLDASTRLSHLSEKLLLLARADAGFLELNRVRVDLVAMLQECVDEASIFAESSGIQISSQLPEKLVIDADGARVMQVLRNLLENAVKYNRVNGRVVMELTNVNGFATLSITNTGAGLKSGDEEKLFTRFYRAEVHRSTPGYGLGLSISREIARAHGGSLSLNGAREDATTFVLALPAMRSAG